MISDDILAGVALLPRKEKVTSIYFYYLGTCPPNDHVFSADVLCACAMGAALIGKTGTTRQTILTTTDRLREAYTYVFDLIPFRKADRDLIVQHLREMNYQQTADYWAYEVGRDIRLYDLIEGLNDWTRLTLEQIAQIVKANGR